MTIRMRNTFALGSFFFSAAAVITVGLSLAWAIVTGNLAPPPPSLLPLASASREGIFGFNFTAVLGAAAFSALSAPVLTLSIFLNFEKTKSQECVYCIAFFLACLSEGVRLLIPVFNLWDANTALLNGAARVMFFGRLMAALSFFTCAVTLVNTQYRESGKYFIILVCSAAFFSAIIPVNTLRLLPNCTVQAGFTRVTAVCQTILFLLTVFAFLFVTKSYEKKDALILTLGYVLFFSGYRVLTVADSFFFAALGALCFIAGMRIYLGTVHKIYMWK